MLLISKHHVRACQGVMLGTGALGISGAASPGECEWVACHLLLGLCFPLPVSVCPCACFAWPEEVSSFSSLPSWWIMKSWRILKAILLVSRQQGIDSSLYNQI